MGKDMTSEDERMNKLFGPAISNLLEESSVRHIWRLSFLVNFFLRPMYAKIEDCYGVSRADVQIMYSLTRRDVLLAQDIALVTGQPKNTISRAVSQLLKKGYILRTTRNDDRRAKSLELTEKGRELIMEIIPKIIRRQDFMRDVLTDSEKETFDELLNRVVFSLPDWVDADLE